jgi:hypothetical protein
MFIPKSFYYFKLGILFYILCKMKNIKSRSSRLSLFNKISEFDKNKDIFEKIYKYIFKRKNCLIFTYYMQIPTIFQPIPDELIYYKPLITFYKTTNNNNNININDNNIILLDTMENFYTNRIIINEHKTKKWLFKFIQDQHIFPDITTTFIPIDNNLFNYMNNFTKKESDVLYLMYYDYVIYIGRHSESNKFKIIYKKDIYNQYNKTNIEIQININKLLYIMALIPITGKEIIQTFDTEILKKSTPLYHNRSDDLTENIIRKFYSLSQIDNLINPYGLFNDADYHCFFYKLKKDLVVINLNKDLFYHKLFDGKDKIDKKKLSHCIDDNNKKQCNFNIIKDYGDIRTWEKNKGKRMLTLIICKSTLFWLDKAFYYCDFLAHYNIDAFIYNYGYFKDKLMGTELGFNKNSEKYVEYIKMKKGEC